MAIRKPTGMVCKSRRTRGLKLERLENRSLLVSDWQNPFGALDVNDSGQVSVLDALLIINDLQRNGRRDLGPAGLANSPKYYVDVNASGTADAVDALVVINSLRHPELVTGLTTQAFHVNLTNGTVNVIGPQPQASNGGEGELFAGSTLKFNTSVVLDQSGDVGRKVLNVSLTNRSGETIGQLPDGTETGLRVLFSPFTNVGAGSDLRVNSTVSTLAGTGVNSSLDGPLSSATFSNPTGTVVDASGSIYVADYGANKIRKIKNGFVSTLAGSGTAGTTDGSGTAASFNNPFGIAINPVDGSLIVTDYAGQKIRRVASDGTVTTIAGTGAAGDALGLGNVATFRNPAGVAVDSSGAIYVVEAIGHRIRKIVLTGTNAGLASNYTVSSLAGSTIANPVAGFADGVGAAAAFNSPQGLAIDANGNLYVADSGNNRVRRVTTLGAVATIAGTGTAGTTNGVGNVATFNAPQGVAVVNDSTLLVSDRSGQKVRHFSLKASSSPASATSWQVAALAGAGLAGSNDGTGTVARFNAPIGIAVDSSRNVFVADYSSRKIRQITPTNGFLPIGNPTGAAPAEPVQLVNADGVIPNQGAGANLPYVSYPGSLANGATTSATDWTFAIPSGVTAFEFKVTVEANTAHWAPPFAVDNSATPGSGVGSPNNQVRTLAGSSTGNYGFADGVATEARFTGPFAVAVDDAGNSYVADFDNNAIRRISAGGQVSTVAGDVGAGTAGSVDGIGTAARFTDPAGVAVSPDGTTIFVAEYGLHLVRRIALTPGADPTNPANWTVKSIVGLSNTPGYANGTGVVARLNRPIGIALGPGGNVYVTEEIGNRVRRLQFKGGDPSFATSWQVSLVAGDDSGTTGASGITEGTGSAARFSFPEYIAADRAGNLYVADLNNHRIRKITSPNSSVGGTVSTLAGSTAGYSDGSGTTAKFSNPVGIAVDSAGFVYVSDWSNSRVRRISPSGVVETVAGTGSVGSADGTGDLATFNGLFDIEVDAAGNLYAANRSIHNIRLIQRVFTVGTS